jgi:hypothetical protein
MFNAADALLPPAGGMLVSEITSAGALSASHRGQHAAGIPRGRRTLRVIDDFNGFTTLRQQSGHA